MQGNAYGTSASKKIVGPLGPLLVLGVANCSHLWLRLLWLIMRVRLKHIQGFKLFVAVYSRTEMCKIEEVFYAKSDFISDQ